jgi:phosphoglycerol transferase MdoB-like AlkP superfamily enzyme/glycerophosphoryl diester phosphodiesterase
MPAENRKNQTAFRRFAQRRPTATVFLLLSGGFLLFSVMFYHRIGAFSGVTVARSLLNTAVLVVAMRVARHCRLSQMIAGLVALLSVLLWYGAIFHVQYFSSVPHLSSIALAGQMADLGDYLGVMLLRLDTLVACAGAVVLLLYVRLPVAPLPKCRLQRFCGLLVILVLTSNFYAIVLKIRKPTRSFMVDMEFSCAVIENVGYLPYLVMQHVAFSRQFTYLARRENPNPPQRIFSGTEPTLRNILILQLESFDYSLIDFQVDGQSVTPYLNDLSRKGMMFSNFYAQHAQGGSSDAELALYTGLLPASDLGIFNTVNLSTFPSLVKILKPHGYSAYAFHGNDGRFWNRNMVYPQLGFDQFFGQSAYTGSARTFQSQDTAFLEQTVPIMQTVAEEPFLFHVITQTMHGPYRLPKVIFRDGGFNVSNPEFKIFLDAARALDDALRTFFTDLENSGLLENTLVVIYGDHSSMLNISGYQRFDPKREHVPLLLLGPGIESRTVGVYGSHVDLAPTILEAMNLPDSPDFFGRSLLKWQPDRLYPITITDAPYIVGPWGTKPIDPSVHAMYHKVWNYSRSHYLKLYSTVETPVFQRYRYIAHGMGAVDGRYMTNARAAFLRSYNSGIRAMEVDFCLSSDRQLVCVHDGYEQRLSLPQAISQTSAEALLECKTDGIDPVMGVDELLDLMVEYDDVYIVPDPKDDVVFCYQRLAERARARGVIGRILPQLYSADDIEAVATNPDFGPAILTLYRTTASDDLVLKVVRGNRKYISAVTMSGRRFSPQLVTRLSQLGVPTYVHTINDPNAITRFERQGAIGVYTDLPDSLLNQKASPLPTGKSSALKAMGGRVVEVSSFESQHEAELMLDGDLTTFWHTRFKPDFAEPPHFVVLEVPGGQSIAGLSYHAWQGRGNGHVKTCSIFVSDDGKSWGEPLVKHAVLKPNVSMEQRVLFPTSTVKRFIKFQITDVISFGDQPTAAIGELDVIRGE